MIKKCFFLLLIGLAGFSSGPFAQAEIDQAIFEEVEKKALDDTQLELQEKLNRVNASIGIAEEEQKELANRSPWGILAELMVALVIVVLLIPTSLWLLKKFQTKMGGTVSQESISVIAQKSMGGGQKIAVIRVGTRVLAVGMTGHSINTLADLSPGEFPEADADRPSDQFASAVDNFMDRFKRPENIARAKQKFKDDAPEQVEGNP